MGFYDVSKEKRQHFCETVLQDIVRDLQKGRDTTIPKYLSNRDTYIGKAAFIGEYFPDKA
ncbi:hypothetical protein FGF1_30120 [Flavobacteriaceae bacterium GF1]